MRRPSLRFLVAIACCLCVAWPASAEGPVIVDLTARVPSRWLSEQSDALPLIPPRWRARVRPECRTRGGYRQFCQGTRNVPAPQGPAAELARILGLGQRATAMWLMTQRPFPEWLEAVRDEDADELLTFPVADGHLGRGFGEPGSPGEVRRHRHEGLDIGAHEGSTIVAARGGLVVYSDDGLTGFGNVVMILHREGFTTMYAHCRRTLVFAGQRVERGQPIAEVGQTGFAPAPHLHFEWRQRGWARDPAGQFHPRS